MLSLVVFCLPCSVRGESLARIIDPPPGGKTTQEESGNPIVSALRGAAAVARGKFFVDPVGPVNYRFSRDNLKAKFEYAGTSMVARIGYDGEHRLELSWRAPEGGDMKFAFKTEDGNRELRLEFVHGF